MIKSTIMRRAGHVARMGDDRFLRDFGGETWGKETTWKS